MQLKKLQKTGNKDEDEGRTQMLLEMLRTARADKYQALADLRMARHQTKGLEVKIKKMEMQFEVDKKRMAHTIKQKQKLKFMRKGVLLE